mmetsp:Transcript_1455/g.2559  ORF Transcript_1455/g.2559 Transcript_1455/m.2559 type:complete len:81 (-) Transcript_1455:30-272(-)
MPEKPCCSCDDCCGLAWTPEWRCPLAASFPCMTADSPLPGGSSSLEVNEDVRTLCCWRFVSGIIASAEEEGAPFRGSGLL